MPLPVLDSRFSRRLRGGDVYRTHVTGVDAIGIIATRSRTLMSLVACAVTVAVLSPASGAVAQQEDPLGSSWYRVDVPEEGFAEIGDQQVVGVVAIESGFVAVGNDATGPVVQPAVWRSPDGVAWERVGLPMSMADPAVAVSLQSVTENNGVIVAVGAQGIGCADTFSLHVYSVCDGSKGVIFSSVDGVQWNRAEGGESVFHSGGDSVISSVLPTDDGFVAVVQWRERKEWHVELLFSADGRAWELAHKVDSNWPMYAAGAIAADGEAVVYVGEAVDTSVVPIHATRRGGGYQIVAEGEHITNIIAASGTSTAFVDVQLDEQSADLLNSFDTVWTSDGTTYSLVTDPGTSKPAVVATTDRISWAVVDSALADLAGNDSTIVTQTSDGYTAVAFNDKDGRLEVTTLTSTDGSTWTATTGSAPPLESLIGEAGPASGALAGVAAIAFADGVGVAVGSDASGGDLDAAFWTTVSPDAVDPEPSPGTMAEFEAPSGCVIKAGSSCENESLAGLDLSGLSAPGVDLTRADLAGANLTGADLSGAILQWADLTGADLTGADLTEVNLEYADLSGAILDGAILDAVVVKLTNFTGASLRGAKATTTNLEATVLVGANLTGAALTASNLANADLSGAVLGEADLAGSDLSNVLAPGADFTDAVMSETDLVSAYFHQATFVGALLRATWALYATMSDVDLSGADLSAAQPSLADLGGSNLSGATIATTNFVGSNLLSAVLPDTDLKVADWGETVCPDGYVTSRWPSPSCEDHRGDG